MSLAAETLQARAEVLKVARLLQREPESLDTSSPSAWRTCDSCASA